MGCISGLVDPWTALQKHRELSNNSSNDFLKLLNSSAAPWVTPVRSSIRNSSQHKPLNALSKPQYAAVNSLQGALGPWNLLGFDPWPSWRHLCAVLGSYWGDFKTILGFLAAGKQLVESDPSVDMILGILGHPGAIWGHPGLISGLARAILGPRWAVLGPSVWGKK